MHKTLFFVRDRMGAHNGYDMSGIVNYTRHSSGEWERLVYLLVSYIPLAHYVRGPYYLGVGSISDSLSITRVASTRRLLDFSSNCTLVERASAYSSPSETLSAGLGAKPYRSSSEAGDIVGGLGRAASRRRRGASVSVAARWRLIRSSGGFDLYKSDLSSP